MRASCCSSSTRGLCTREASAQEGRGKPRAGAAKSKPPTLYFEKGLSCTHSNPYLTDKPLPSLLLAWTKSKTPSTSGPTVYRLPNLMISEQLPAVHRSYSLDRQFHVLTSPGERGLDSSLGLQGLLRKRTTGALKLVKLAPAWAQRGAFPQAKMVGCP